MSLARYLSKLGALLNSSGQVGATGLQDAAVTAAKLASGAARSNFGAGAVLQVVQGTTTSYTTTTSTSFVATNLSATITPSSTNSKILALVSTTTWLQGAFNDYVILSLFRNGTNIGGGAYTSFVLNSGAYSPTYDTIAAFHCLDSPESTSALTYNLRIRSYGGNGVSVNDSSNTNTIILMEIAG